MLLYIVRHGDPNYEDDCLTERGWLQAEAVGKRIAASGINQIYSSPMGRAQQTAAPACRLLNLPCHIEPWAHEVEDERLTPFPDGESKSISYVQSALYRADGNIDLPYDRAFEAPGFNTSGMEKAVKLIEEGGRNFLDRLGYREENGVYRILSRNQDKVALFCHTVMTRAWLSTLLHIPIHLMWSGFTYTHTGVTILEFPNYANGFTAPRVLCYSDMSHLYAHGPDMCFDGRTDIIL